MKSISALLLFFGIALSACSQNDSVYICKSPNAYRYHSKPCSWFNNCTHSRAKVTRKEAIRLGYTPCTPCYGRSASANDGTIKPVIERSYQCSATTRKGTRCSRSSRSNGYCWQHGG